MKTTPIAIIDNWELYREGIALLLADANFQTIIKAVNERELLSMLSERTFLPDICIFNANVLERDLTIPGLIREQWPAMKIVAYTSNDNETSESIFAGVCLDKYVKQNDDLKLELTKLGRMELLPNSY